MTKTRRGYERGLGNAEPSRTRKSAPLNNLAEEMAPAKRRRTASDYAVRTRSKFSDEEQLLHDLLEAPQTREIQQQIKDLMESISRRKSGRETCTKGRVLNADYSDEQDNAEVQVGDQGSDSPPAWSRGRNSGSTLKKHADKRSKENDAEDDVEDFDDEVQDAALVPRSVRCRARLDQQTGSAEPRTKRGIITRQRAQNWSLNATTTTTSEIHATEDSPGEEDEADDEELRGDKESEGGSDMLADDAENETDEEEEEEEEEDGNEPAGTSRYPARNRVTVDHYDPSRFMQQSQRQQQREETPDQGDSMDEDTDQRAPAHRYPLRDRARLANQATPPKEQEQNRLRAGPVGRAQRLGFGVGPRRGGGRRARPSYHSYDDDIMDQDPDNNWAALNAGTKGGDSGNIAGGTGRRAQPWEVALGEVGALDNNGERQSKNVEITPVQVDTSVTFDQVGGLEHYIKALKEMVFLPLVYPELFERFHITPPRGVLFYGPPGTGKTLVARALAAHASKAGKKVSFFMRKGADVLSKWVGEAERQLRLLFEEAQKAQPAIIFFDEIDGLAPVRSSKQDQIHNSIVSTLLALMDGLDSRGQVVVIGATNRIDALDGALRRPGRFDRELVFPLPNLQARSLIIDIHTRKWAQPPPADLRQELANKCVGYCGADLKALCTEASLKALRRRFPQIYASEQKLLLDPKQVSVDKQDFLAAFSAIVPASYRSAAAHARPLTSLVAPVLKRRLDQILAELASNFPPAAACLQASASKGGLAPATQCTVPLYSDGDDDDAEGSTALSITLTAGSLVSRPRLLICGPEGAGQAHLAPALLYALEGLPVHAIGLPSLLSDASARSPEEAIVHAVVEARRAAPAILYLPHLTLWWDTAPASLRATLWMLLADLPADLPLLLFATADAPVSELPHDAMTLFGRSLSAHELTAPDSPARAALFDELATEAARPAKQRTTRRARPPPPELPLAPDALAAQSIAAKQKEQVDARRIWEEDEAALRSLRMALREIATKLLCNRQWKEFWEPISPEEDPEYYSQVQTPMDLGTILCRVDNRQYPTAAHFMADVALISQGAQQYWGEDPQGIPEISRAKALEDQTWEAVSRRLPPELTAKCEDIHAKGGPAPPPAGIIVPVGQPVHVEVLSKPNNTADANPAGAVEARASRRLRGSSVDRQIMFQDPEAIMRAQRLAKRGRFEPGQPPGPASNRPSAEPEADVPMASEMAAERNSLASAHAAEASKPPDCPDEGRSNAAEHPALAPGQSLPEGQGGARTDASHTVLEESNEAVKQQQNGSRLLRSVSLAAAPAAVEAPSRQLANGGSRLIGGFRAALANFSSALHASDSPHPKQRPTLPASDDILSAENGVDLPTIAAAQTQDGSDVPMEPNAGAEANAKVLEVTTRQNLPNSSGSLKACAAKAAPPSTSARGVLDAQAPASDRPKLPPSGRNMNPQPATAPLPSPADAAAANGGRDESAVADMDCNGPVEEGNSLPSGSDSPAEGLSVRPQQDAEAATRLRATKMKGMLVKETNGLLLDALECLHSRISRTVHDHRYTQDRELVLLDVGTALQEGLRALRA